MNTETLGDQSIRQASYQHAMLREHIAALQEQLLGYELIRAAGEAGLAVGNTDVFAAGLPVPMTQVCCVMHCK